MASSTPWAVQPTPQGQPQLNNPASPDNAASSLSNDAAQHQFTQGVEQAQSKAARDNANKMHLGPPRCDYLCQWQKQHGNKEVPHTYKKKDGYKWDGKAHPWVATGGDEGELTTETDGEYKSGTFTDANGNQVSYENAEDPSSVTTTYKNDVSGGVGGGAGSDAPAGAEGSAQKVGGGSDTFGPYPIQQGAYPPGIGPQFFKGSR